MDKKAGAKLIRFYEALYGFFGPQGWWPGETAFEIMVGAVLTQNTNWGNVERAIQQLKTAGLLSPGALHKAGVEEIAQLIRPSGYYNIKARRLKNLLDLLFGRYRGRIALMSGEPLPQLRCQLLAVNGVGPETADSILLYALNKPVFVVDAYTRRWMYRHRLIPDRADYPDIQKIFMSGMEPDVALFNEYHALIVRLGKEFCRPRPRCEACPLNRLDYSLKNRCPHCFRAAPLRKMKTLPAGICGCV